MAFTSATNAAPPPASTAEALRIADYTFPLPPERIALHPLPQRDTARLLVHRPGQPPQDRIFRDLPEVLPPGSLLVFNDTQVVPARLLFRRQTGAWIEIFCLKPEGCDVTSAMQSATGVVWNCLVGSGRRWKAGETLHLDAGQTQLQADRLPDSDAPPEPGQARTHRIRFSWTPGGVPFASVLLAAGQVPLPPYLNRPPVPEDLMRYQTVYAQQAGAVAAPTAGLHFTPEVLAALEAAGFGRTTLTLHVGAGTFQPVSAEVMAQHLMHAEEILVSRQTLLDLTRALAEHQPVIAVGTTSLRTLESLYWFGLRLLQGQSATSLQVEQWEPYKAPRPLPPPPAALAAILDWLDLHHQTVLRGETRLLIAPGYPIQLANGLITNFHQPNSTLLLLIAAFVGAPNWRPLYDHALANGYRFLSYGDSSLLLR